MAVSSLHNGWRYDAANVRLDFYYRGTRVGHINASGMSQTVDVAFEDDDSAIFGSGGDAEILWSTGDASNHSTVIALGDSNQALHVTDLAAKATDWNVSADTHPTVYVHSNTTPATDYITIGGHDGTTGAINVVGGTTLDLRIGGTDTAAFTASTWVHSAANSGAVSSITITNTSNDASAGARIEAVAGGASASGDAILAASESGSHVVTLGIDTSSNIGVLAMNTALGSADGDAIRITDATPPVITYNATHPTGTFDYVCDSCGAHGATQFSCCGTVSWHDDVLALAPVLNSVNGLRLSGDEPGVQHLARLGVMEVSPSDLPDEEGKNFVGIRLDAAQWYTWSAMQQMYNRISELESKLQKVM